MSYEDYEKVSLHSEEMRIDSYTADEVVSEPNRFSGLTHCCEPR